MRGAAMVADDAQHVARGSARSPGRRRARRPSRPRSRRQTPVMIAVSAPQMRAALGRVVGDARRHQQAADIGVAEAERAVVVGQLGDLLRRELRHQHRDLEHDRPEPDGVLDRPRRRSCRRSLRNASRLSEARLQAVSSRNMYSEHGLEARDRAVGRAGVPVVDGGVELDAGIGAGPGGVADLVPQLARLQRLGDLAVLAAGSGRQSPSVRRPRAGTRR